tara:strand:+ start:143 stop:373 length:231 start_codon:yes stop_codon:yes gene_type:complete
MMDIKVYDWNFVYKIRDSGDVVYTVTIPAKEKEDAVEIFKREHPNGLICRGIRRGDVRLLPFKELPSPDPWEKIVS